MASDAASLISLYTGHKNWNSFQIIPVKQSYSEWNLRRIKIKLSNSTMEENSEIWK